MNPSVKGWTIHLSRLSDFWEPQINVVDENETPVIYLDAKITISPEGHDPVIWSISNGKLSMPSVGVFSLSVPKSEIVGYQWSMAPYKWSVTYTNTKEDGVWMEDVVRVSD